MIRTISLVILLLTAAAFAGRARTVKWHDPANWSKLAKQMTERDVMQLLGKPVDTETTGTTLFYLYQPPGRSTDGSLVSRPEYGFVRFTINPRTRTSRRQTYILSAYKPVNTDLLPKPEPIVQPPAPGTVTVDAAVQKAEAAEQAKQRASERALKNEAAKQRRIERNASTKQQARSIPAARETAADIHTKKSSRLFFMIGGLAFACAVIITYLKNKTEGFGAR